MMPSRRPTAKTELEISQIINAIRLIQRTHQLYSQELMRKYGISGRQLGALRLMADSPQASLGELSRRMYLHSSTISGIVARLEKKGYAVREHSREDRRVVYLRLTPTGRAIIRRTPISGFGRLVRDIPTLPAAEIHRLLRAMKTLLGVMQTDGDITNGSPQEP